MSETVEILTGYHGRVEVVEPDGTRTEIEGPQVVVREADPVVVEVGGPSGPAGEPGAPGAPGATLLAELTDVDLTGLDHGEVLTWDADDQRWEPTLPEVPDFPLVHYTHVQLASSDEWLIEHPLGYEPSVSVVDSGGSVVVGDVEYLSPNLIRIRFTAPFAGRAYLS